MYYRTGFSRVTDYGSRWPDSRAVSLSRQLQVFATRLLSILLTIATMSHQIKIAFSRLRNNYLPWGTSMRGFSSFTSFGLIFLFSILFLIPGLQGQSTLSKNRIPLRVGIVGLVHGHVQGFFDNSLHSPEIEIVGIAESDASVSSYYATRYHLDRNILFAGLDEMLERTHPQAVLVYTNTYGHRRVVETCARHGVHVMMEKPLAVSLDDALAIEKAAHLAVTQANGVGSGALLT